MRESPWFFRFVYNLLTFGRRVGSGTGTNVKRSNNTKKPIVPEAIMDIEIPRRTSWLNMNAKVKQTRILIHQYGTKVPSNFTLYTQGKFPCIHKNGSNGDIRPPDGKQLQLLFLCASEPGSESTLFTANLPNLEEDKEFHGVLPWTKLIDSTGFPQQTANTSKEELLMSERKRCAFWGINSYEFSSQSGTVIFPANGSLFQTSVNGSVGFKEIQTMNASLNAVMSPVIPNYIAYYARGNIWLYDRDELSLCKNIEPQLDFVSLYTHFL